MSYKEVRTEMESRLDQSVLHGYMTKTKVYACRGPLERGVNMRMDLQCCSFKNCKHNFDGNCTKRIEHERCEFNAIMDILGDDYDLDRLRVMMNQRISLREEVHERFKLTGDIPLDRLRELVQADKDGRCVVLPCKVGEKVYRIDRRLSGNHVIEERVFDLTYFKPYDIGKTVFLTPEAAEAALKGEQP